MTISRGRGRMPAIVVEKRESEGVSVQVIDLQTRLPSGYPCEEVTAARTAAATAGATLASNTLGMM